MIQDLRARESTQWTPASWREFPAAQQPDWPDEDHVRRVGAELAALPPLVTAPEVYALRRALCRVAHAGGFVVQAGDCAETFAAPDFVGTAAKVRLLHDAAKRLHDELKVPVVPIGRIAGQYGKPRSSPTERVGDQVLPSFRGEIVNGREPTAAARTPDPARMRLAYQHSAEVFGILRELAAAGLALSGRWGSETPAVWTSHEALVLDYEEPMVRFDEETGAWLLTSTHLPWIGARTCEPDGAHVRFLAGVANPVGLKVGPGCTPGRLEELCARLDPDRQPGRLVLIARMGAGVVGERLPELVRAVAASGHPVVWMSDPMHGNTRAAGPLKTRRIGDVLAELAGFTAAVRGAGGWPGGLHLEATPEDVTECVGGRDPVVEADLPLRYRTACDPRLNGDQADEVVAAMAALCARRRP
ncbi:3-deoxy-D-arabinoheptulosonate-7-phosphate synthase [Amycolatopsis xylanica]|uniref:Phospho-2-dehydro-3-deoxyheptonate aldolase n=1 Tax=Amycolatopsis xylanica TaxID=589385 RepID=A0A1H2WBB0_9PSEU|nr:3-deoxy-7-phosphoheptulonate synthase [Amycolatopsis xylanica]SDW77564.1 3-deoxy-D-arabinoheptulosonate-7-phosphate synthase [Amycolatopsis xylanica]